MAQPSSRGELIEYVKRKLGAPVLEINVSDEQIEDLVDDAVQFFQERHFDGVIQTFLKYQVTQEDIDRGRAPRNNSVVGLTTEAVSTSIVGTATTFRYYENSNFLPIPSSVIGVNRIFTFDEITSGGLIKGGMFNPLYQGYLNSYSVWGSSDILTYYMAQTYSDTLNFLFRTHKQIDLTRDKIDFTLILIGKVLA